MGMLVRTLDAFAETRAADIIERFTPASLSSRLTGPGPSTAESAMRLAVVLTCIRIYAEAVASLPLICYRRLPGGDRERDSAFYLSELLQYEPNPEMTAVTFIETLTAHVVGWGNGYAEIVRDAGNRPTELWPLRPDRMLLVRERGALVYRYHTLDGRTVDLAPSQVLHIPGLSFNGLTGLSILANQRAVELAQAAEEYGTSVWANNARPAIVLSHPKTLTVPAIERLSAQFEQLKGSRNAGKTVVMEEGLTLSEVGIPPQEAQYIETRKFQRAEIIGMFLIPPHMAGDTERSTSWGAGIAEQNQKWLDLGLGMYLRRWEQSIRRSLITSAYRQTNYVEFLRDALLRGDPLKRAQIQHIRWMDGQLSADDINQLENRNRLPDGQGAGYYVPANMLPVTDAGTATLAPAARSWVAALTDHIPDAMDLVAATTESGVAAPAETLT
jgi:HK97 family phage portal protein